MASNRFPGKALAPLAGKPMIAHVIERVKYTGVDVIVVATSDQLADDSLANYLHGYEDVKVFRGSHGNPLERMYRAAYENGAEIALRITADCPLIDSRSIIFALGSFSLELDYYGKTNSPDGDDVEVFSMRALRAAYMNASLGEVEHTTTWIRRNMKCDSTESDPEWADVHYSVNTLDDLKTCELLLKRCGEGARWQDYCAAYRELKA
jgi:spore coat polysaccharide biosynthesis protein SpsF